MITKLVSIPESDYVFVINLIWTAILGPPLVLGIVGILLHRLDKEKIAIRFFITSGIYLLAAIGVCEAWLWIGIDY